MERRIIWILRQLFSVTWCENDQKIKKLNKYLAFVLNKRPKSKYVLFEEQKQTEKQNHLTLEEQLVGNIQFGALYTTILQTEIFGDCFSASGLIIYFMSTLKRSFGPETKY